MATSRTYPQQGETCAFPQHGVVKRTGLLFDRLHASIGFDEIPEEIQFWVPEAHGHFKGAQRKVIRLFMKGSHPKPGYTPQQVADVCRDSYVQTQVEAHRRAGFHVVPVYDHQRQFLMDFPSGGQTAYQAALANLPDVVEENATWDQILDFRKDKDAVRKYRALRLWLHDSLHARSLEEATDIICLKVEDYEWALRKHGFKTATGAISSILDWKGLTAIIGGGRHGSRGWRANLVGGYRGIRNQRSDFGVGGRTDDREEGNPERRRRRSGSHLRGEEKVCTN